MVRSVALLVLLSVLAPPVFAADAFDKGMAAWERSIDRPPLAKRLGGMIALARTRDPRAVRVIAARYAKPRVPKDHERYLLARMCGEYLTGPEHVEPLAKFLAKHRRDADGWLWRNGVVAAAREPDVGPVVRWIENDRENPFVRAGALEALAAEGRVEILALIPSLLGEKLPRKETARAMLAVGAASGLLAQKDRRGTPEFSKAAETLVALLESRDVPDYAKLGVARHLAKALDSRKVTLDPAWWRKLLARDESEEGGETKSVAFPRFMGLEATGRRVVFLIDLSDSMLDPLSYTELDRARQVPLDGSEPFPWEKVKNRFDFAREHLKRSLRALEPDVRFAVIGFGDEAEPFRSTGALVPASKGNVAKAIRELSDIEAKPDTTGKDRPYGVLRGDTNLHGALLRAFQITSRGFVREDEHVAEATFREGADTIFLLSDGKPTRDDFFALDTAEPGRTTTDAEKGETRKDDFRRTGNFFGPYRNPDHLLADLDRLNLFRKAEIHTVSMGTADLDLMHRIAMQGLGRYRNLGGNGVLDLNGGSALSVEIPEKPEQFTLECWVRCAQPRRASCIAGDRWGGGLAIYLSAKEKPYAWVDQEEEGLRVDAGDEWKWKDWNHLALTFDGSRLRFFVNGKLAGEAAGGTCKPSGRRFVVGAQPNADDGPRWFLRGALDDLRLSSTVRYEKQFSPPKTLQRDAATLLLLQFDGDGETPFADGSDHRRPVRVHGRPRVRGEER